MIVSLEFNREIEDRAAVERAVHVTAEPPVEVRPHWFGGERLDFRPETYWKPGTRVTVGLRLRDVEGAPGVYGQQHKTFSFTVGRHQVSVVDAAKHTMRVERGDGVLATLPVTTGAPRTTTYNGKMVVTEMLEVTRMNGATVGFRKANGKGEYDIPDVPHAMRLTTSGTFLHGNYWAPDAFGRANVSHGCVGLRDVKGGDSGTPMRLVLRPQPHRGRRRGDQQRRQNGLSRQWTRRMEHGVERMESGCGGEVDGHSADMGVRA